MKNKLDLEKLKEVSSIVMFIYLCVLSKDSHEENNNKDDNNY